MHILPRKKAPRPEGADALETALRRSARAILAERLLRLFAALATLALFFLTLSWIGLWRDLPVEARMTGVGLFGFAALYLVVREAVRGWPRRRAAAARLDAEAGGPLKPAASLDDRLAGAADPQTDALWALHRQRLLAALARTPIAPPRPRLPERDPYALRALALVAAVAAAFVAGDEKGARLAAALDWRVTHRASGAQRLDAWFEPPAYTGRPPIVLAQESGGVEAPVNSTLRLRPADGPVSTEGALTPMEGDGREEVFSLLGPARLALPDGRNFEVAAIPDMAPQITLDQPPQNNTRGTMTLAYRLSDDYGVVSAEALFTRPEGARRALYEPPRLPLDLPAGAGGLGEGRATLDLADSPYAGAKAVMRLVAKDAAGNEGAATPVEITLPQRRFLKPLARALVEQRRLLALDPAAQANVRMALEALALAPEAFDTPSSVFLGLQAAHDGLEGKRSDDELRGVADILWAMALKIEDGDASEAERDLRAAEKALREAMARGDSEEEIAARTQELRAALEKFLEQVGARPSPPGEERQSAEDPDSVTADDLQSMLDEIEQAAKSGDTAQAQKLLDELQDIMENAQTGEAAGQTSAARKARQREMQRALGELDQLARDQQQLRDDTFRGLQSPLPDDPRKQPGKNGKSDRSGEAQQGAGASAEQKRQQALREKLESQQDALKGDAGEAGEELDAARKAMKEAESALGPSGEGRGEAVEAQGRAVDALRKGADRLAQQMRGEGEQGAEGEEGQSGKGKGGKGKGRRARRGMGRDPLGRSSGGQASTRGKYDPLGLPPAQRAHRVQEELRRRLGQPERPTEELDYLQRLLTR